MKKLWLVCFLLLGALPLALYPFVLLANVMSLAGPRSGSEPLVLVILSTTFFAGTLAYPLVYLFCAAAALVRIRKNSGSALRFAFGPIAYLIFLVGLAAIWSWTEQGMITLRNWQEKNAATSLGACAQAAQPDNGDGLTTTGCGELKIGESGTGQTDDPLQAHNWVIQVESNPLYSNRLAITLKNDGTSCPDIRILDSKGRPADGFEVRQFPAICMDGGITTSFFRFDPSKNGTYILRIFTPITPGAYWVTVEQK